MARQRFIDDGILRGTADAPRLVGGSCTACGLVSFPRAQGCARCGGEDIEPRELATAGTLWTWTTQGFLPKRPYAGPETAETFVPFALGYVELPDGIRVEARILVDDVESLVIGQEMRLVTAPQRTDDDGTEVLMFAFTPATTQEVGA